MASKFRTMLNTPWKKDQCHNMRVSKSCYDSTLCSVNTKFLAVITESAEGGAFIVIKLLPQDKVVKLSDRPVVSGHKGPVLDIAFSPHNDNLIASGSEDCSVKLWLIPDEGLTKTLTEPITTLSYHQKRVVLVLWHPTAENVLLSGGSEVVVIWDIANSVPNIVIESHPDVVYSASWNWDGSRFLTTCRDKKIRIINSRSGVIEQEATSHEGSKASRAIFLKDGRVFSTGFSQNGERQFSLRDPSKLNEPLYMMDLDRSNKGVLFPLYNPDANLIYLYGKGDMLMCYYELTSDAPYVHYIATLQLQGPHRGIGMMVKRGCNISADEIDRFYLLNCNCQVITMSNVPRKSTMYQEALLVEEWFTDRNEMMELKTGFDENDNNLHPKLIRRSSIPISVHPQLGYTQSLPMDTTNHSLREEVGRLTNRVDHLMEPVRNLEGTVHQHLIQNLEIRNDVITRVTPVKPTNLMDNTNKLTISRSTTFVLLLLLLPSLLWLQSRLWALIFPL